MRYLLHDVFSQTVLKTPRNIAIKEENGRKTSYFHLNQLSNQFAHCIRTIKQNIRENPYVGILSTVHTNSIAAVLGTLKIGGAYVPLDEYSPTERLNHIIENTKLDVIIVDEPLFQRYHSLYSNPSVNKIIVLSSSIADLSDKFLTLNDVYSSSNEDFPVINQVSDDLAYILHSSGSTGVPKGIMLTHRNARTFVDWMDKEFCLSPADIVMSRAPFKFDLSIFDIFNTLKAGACLICYDWHKSRPDSERHKDYVKLMENEKATILYTTPSTFIALMHHGGLEKSKLHLRQIMYAGEPFPVPQLKKLMWLIPSVKIANIYGPTETNIITYYHIDKNLTKDDPIPLGNEVEDTEILIVNKDRTRICDPGEIGEIWCRGGTVTLGYLGQPELTNSHCVESPFHLYPAKFWRTGDYGFRDEKGIIHYKGRNDHMVKVKGYRIEIGEIESALAKCPSLNEFVVVAIPDEKYGNKLYCFFVPKDKHSISEQGLRHFLLQYLPQYMVPYQFIKTDILPKTSSEKIDRMLLANRAESHISSQRQRQ